MIITRRHLGVLRRKSDQEKPRIENQVVRRVPGSNSDFVKKNKKKEKHIKNIIFYIIFYRFFDRFSSVSIIFTISMTPFDPKIGLTAKNDADSSYKRPVSVDIWPFRSHFHFIILILIRLLVVPGQ